MKRRILWAVLIITFMLGAYTEWEENGLPIRKESNLSWQKTAATLSDYSSVIVWSDAVNGYQQVKAARIDTQGNHLWQENGVIIADNNYMPQSFKIINSNDNSVIIVWEENHFNAGNYLYCQKLNEEGEKLWPEEGILLLVSDINEINYEICTDEFGGFFILNDFNDFRQDIRLQHITFSGTIAEGFNENGNVISSGDSPRMIAAGEGMVYCSWRNNWQIFLQKIDFHGNLMWSENGISAEFAYWDNKNQQLMKDSQENLYVTSINDTRGRDLFCQKISPAGELLWQEPQLLQEAMLSLQYLTLISNNDSFINCCLPDSHHIKLQKFDSNGDLLSEHQTEFNTDNAFNLHPALQVDNGSIWLSWNTCNADNSQILLQKFTADCEPVFGNDGIIIAEEEYHRDLPLLSPQENGKTAVFWLDKRNSRDGVYLQKIDSEGIIEFSENGIEIYGCLAGNTSNMKSCATDLYTAVIWYDSRSDGLYNIYLQLVDNNNGEILLTENGIPIKTNLSEYHHNCTCTFSENGQSIAIVWVDQNDETTYPRLQILDINGNRLLGENGENLADETGGLTIYEELYINAYDDGFNIGWCSSEGFVNFSQAFIAQRYENLQPQWGDGITIIDNADNEPNIMRIEVNKNYFCWLNNLQNLRIQKISNNGDLLWDDAGILAGQVEDNMINAFWTKTDADDISLFWNYTQDNYNFLCTQYVTSEGELSYEPNGLILFAEELQWQNYSINYDENAFYFGSEDYNGLQLKKTDLQGNLLWEYQPSLPGQNFAIDGIETIADMLVLYYSAQTVSYDRNIYGLFLDTEGNIYPETPETGFPVCTAWGSQNLKNIYYLNENENIIVWNDERSLGIEQAVDPSIYIQKVNLPLIVNADENGIVDFNVINNYPNPFQSKTCFTAPALRNPKNTAIEIYNVRGQLVRKLIMNNEKTEWNCRDNNGNTVSAGVYFYRLRSENEISSTQKMILLK